ncbi:T-complex protein 1 subunit theta-like [Saccoglossus kowalevskii]
MVVLASQQMEQEIGDGTNFVIVFAGALLNSAEEILRMGLSPTEVIEGYEKALKKALEILPELSCGSIKDITDKEDVTRVIKSSIMSKQYGNEDFFAKLVTEACMSVYSNKKVVFNVDNVRVTKILGSGVLSSSVLQGMVFKRNVEGNITKVSNAKVACYTCPIDYMQTETKGTVLIKSAEELKSFSKGEESQLEQQIKAIADSGCTVVVSGGKVGDMALHFLNKYNIMVVRLLSKWDLRRLCKTINATALPRITPPTTHESGHCDQVMVAEIGDTSVVIFKQEKEESAISTVVIRGSTDNLMDDVEKAVDDGVNTFRALTRDNRYLPGAGATEIELAKRLTEYGDSCPGIEQYAIKKFAEALEDIPRTLAENAGVKATEVLSKLYAAHQEGKQNVGFDIEGEGSAVKDIVQDGVLDPYLTKYWSLKLAGTAAVTVLRVDQIIMAKAAGGPKAPKPGPMDADDD